MEICSRTDSGRSSYPRRPTIERIAGLVRFPCLALVLLIGCPVESWAQQPGPAAPGSGAADLEAFLDGVETLTADFKQQIRAADEHVLETASGSVALSRPNRFRWLYEKPHAQQIVADGKDLWVYDVELDQATRTPLDETSPSSPAMLLSGDKAVRRRFDVVESFEKDGLAWVRLRPNLPGTDFRSVLIAFEGRSPRRLQLEDTLNQLTDIELYNVVVNPKLRDRLFEFKPPRGVDVIGAGD